MEFDPPSTVDSQQLPHSPPLAMGTPQVCTGMVCTRNMVIAAAINSSSFGPQPWGEAGHMCSPSRHASSVGVWRDTTSTRFLHAARSMQPRLVVQGRQLRDPFESLAGLSSCTFKICAASLFTLLSQTEPASSTTSQSRRRRGGFAPPALAIRVFCSADIVTTLHIRLKNSFAAGVALFWQPNLQRVESRTSC